MKGLINVQFSFSTGFCPEDHTDVKGVDCKPDYTNCDELTTTSTSTTTTTTTTSTTESVLRTRRQTDKLAYPTGLKCRALSGKCEAGKVVFKAHGPLTGNCVPSDRLACIFIPRFVQEMREKMYLRQRFLGTRRDN